MNIQETLNERTFTFEEVKEIANDVINLGMILRQNQLSGCEHRSGNEVLQEYFDELTCERD